jgi:hypothetical protein
LRKSRWGAEMKTALLALFVFGVLAAAAIFLHDIWTL